MKTISGFDYVLMKPVERTRQEWREFYERMRGTFSQKHGETWVYTQPRQDERGFVWHTILAEIYDQGVLR